MKLFKNISGPELLALLTPIILIIPNAVLNFTEHLSLFTSIVNIILPLSVYLLITTSFKKVGVSVWCLLPIMIYCGFQIVLLYLYSCSIIGVDMFLNVVTSNPGEIAELLGNLIIAIGSLVIVYVPALVYAAICISKKLEIYPGADKTSIMMILPHRPGSLYKVLARLYTLGINVTKLESRPIPDREFEFMFYFDLETSIYSEEYVQLICELDELCEEFKYLGSYTEVI